MSKQKHLQRQAPNPAPNPAPVNPQSLGTRSPGPVIEISEFTFLQQSALPSLVVARSLAQASRDTGVAESTLRRWLKDPQFREELDRLRQEACDLARQQAVAALPACIAVVARIATECQDPAVSLRAARTLINYATRVTGEDRLTAEIKELNEAVEAANSATPIR